MSRLVRVLGVLLAVLFISNPGTALPTASIETTYFNGCNGQLEVTGSRFQGCDGSRLTEGVLDGHWKQVWTENCESGAWNFAVYEKCNGSWVYRGTNILDYCPCAP
ncbi:MAG TPA: hypothetical protein VEK57_12945 [Thermoanaerobaculia bacterium]|nr:hypothetical protein [Thermoanaerobaculia bacterium]